ncbi:MAG: phosphoribosylglycinamide formyltransferase [Candidatus Cloacimonetes bacterium]|nr:phosphoribosylglycinamide formyltransferase [Candidatus Cloacimonadota bacterium]
MKRIAVITSGRSRGSNFEAIARFLNDKPVEIAFVVVTSRRAPIIERCAELGVPALYFPMRDMAAFEAELLQALRRHDVSLIALAGFLRKFTPAFLRDCPCPLVNIHPALLPAYGGQGMYGIRVHEAVFAAGERVSGATVHYVNEEYDAGDIIAQREVDITACTTPQEVASAALRVEHELYPNTVWGLLQKL